MIMYNNLKTCKAMQMPYTFLLSSKCQNPYGTLWFFPLLRFHFAHKLAVYYLLVIYDMHMSVYILTLKPKM